MLNTLAYCNYLYKIMGKISIKITEGGKKQEKWVNIVKGIAIIAVVTLHTNFVFGTICKASIYALLGGLWHVPVFLIVGGFYIKES